MNRPSRLFSVPLRVYVLLISLMSQAALPIYSSGHGVTARADWSNKLHELSQVGDGRVHSKLGLYFEPNSGQTDSQVKFLSRGSGYTLFLTSTAAVLSLIQGDEHKVASSRGNRNEVFQRQMRASEDDAAVKSGDESEGRKTAAVRMQMVGANPDPFMEGVGRLTGISNYFIGNDPEKWRTNIPHFSRVQYHDVYPGVDLVYHINDGELEFDFIVGPGAETGIIKLSFEGAQKVYIDNQGDLVLTTEAGEIRQHKPILYQNIDEVKKEVAGRFVQASEHEFGFEVGEHDRNRPLVIDPKVSFSTFLGLPASNIAVDDSGNIYVAGTTSSLELPVTPGVFQNRLLGSRDAFVFKLNATGTELLYSTYFGGKEILEEGANAIAVDSAGNAYMTGITSSEDFPTTRGASQTEYKGIFLQGDAFVAKLNANGSELVYSTYLGGNRSDRGTSIAVDSAGNAYVTGRTSSSDFPTTPGVFGRISDAAFNIDSFITKLNESGTDLVYSTYSNVGQVVVSHDIAVDSSGNAYVAGLEGLFAFFAERPFVIKLNPSASDLIYSTRVGDFNFSVSIPEGINNATGITVDSSGNAYVTGGTSSRSFPTTANAFQKAFAGGTGDAFVTKLSDEGTVLYSTYLGGSAFDSAADIAVDSLGNAYVVGQTESEDFPTRLPLQAINGGLFFSDAFVTKIDAAGTALVYSTYFGGRGDDRGSSIAFDASDNAYMAGVAGSPDLPITPGAFQKAKQSGFDNFVVKIESTPLTGGFSVMNASVVFDTLFVVGEGFDRGAVIVIDGKEQATKNKKSDHTVLTSKKAAKKLKPGRKVAIQVRNLDGRLTDALIFMRPER